MMAEELHAQLMRGARKIESENEENKIDTVRAKSTISDHRDDQFNITFNIIEFDIVQG